MTALAVALAIGIPAVAVALAQGIVARQAIDAIWRQPEVAGQVQTFMFIGLAFLEALAIYGLLIAILLLGKV